MSARPPRRSSRVRSAHALVDIGRADVTEAIALAARMKRLQIWLDVQCGWAKKGWQFSGAPFGDGYASVDPDTNGAAASGNFNRFYVNGREPGLEPGAFAQIGARFAAEGIEPFFVHLRPGPDMGMVRGWLRDAGFAQNEWTRYPVMVRDSAKPVTFETDLAVRAVSAQEVARAAPVLGETMWDGYRVSAGKPGMHHFMAFDGARPVAVAALAVHEGLGYLGWMSTAESARRRGAQQALIAARVAKAQALGCDVIVSETLTMLATSLANLERAGFREAYETEVWGAA